MESNPFHSTSGPAYSDRQVLDAIQSGNDHGQLVLKWFFGHAQEYARQFLRKQYANLDSPEWDVIFANTNLKLIKRIRNGLELSGTTKLATYYVSVAKFAALDYVREQREDHLPVREDDRLEQPQVEIRLEAEERSRYVREWLSNVLQNAEQVKVLLLQTKGYSFREIVERTDYNSEGACRNALLKGKQKISTYLLENPEESAKLRALLLDQ